MEFCKRIKYYASFITPDSYINSWCDYPESILYMITRVPIPEHGLKRNSYTKQAINAAHFGYKYSICLGYRKYGFFKTRWQAHLACKILKLYQLKLKYGIKIKLWRNSRIR